MPFNIYGLAAAAAGYSHQSGTPLPFVTGISGVGVHPSMGHFGSLHGGSIASIAGCAGMYRH